MVTDHRSELNMNNPIKTSYVEKQFIVQECLKPDEKKFRQKTTYTQNDICNIHMIFKHINIDFRNTHTLTVCEQTDTHALIKRFLHIYVVAL